MGVVGGACTTTPMLTPSREPLPVPLEVVERFPEPEVLCLKQKMPRERGRSMLHSGTLLISGEELNYYYYMPKEKTADVPFVSVLPILGGGDGITEMVCERLSSYGLAAGTLDRKWKLFRQHETIDQLEQKFIDAVRNQRAFISWVETQPGIDGRFIGTFGLSAGGIIATDLIAVDKRVDAAVICLAGGGLSTLILDADETRTIKWVAETCEKLGITTYQLEKKIAAEMDVDPADFAAYIDPNDVLFAQARFDGVVPERNYRILREALGFPETVKVPFGHYSSIIGLNYLTAKGSRFMKERFRNDGWKDGE